MADLLLELFSEEIPARMQRTAAADLQRLVLAKLGDAGVDAKALKATAHVTPRRLALFVEGLAERTPDTSEERKGPKVDAPEKAIEGFLRSTGLTRDQLVEEETKKGTFLMARIEKPGQAMAEIIAEAVPEIIRSFPWPKSQRWGSGSLRWVRPLQSILCLFDGKVVPFDVDGIQSGNVTYGHRFMAPDAITVTDFAQYQSALRDAKVILDSQERATLIADAARKLCEAEGLSLVESDALAIENAGLNEWPTPLMGSFDEAFLDVPAEVLKATMAKDQKYFAVNDASGKMANRFVLTTNLLAEDGGKAIIDGNQRVLRARLSDARFFWEQDKKHTLESRLPKLDDIVFHAKLGTVGQKAQRMVALSGAIAEQIGADKPQAELAAKLAKADLVADMVFEFPEVQGVIGGYLARAEGLGDGVANAIASHYQPAGPDDDCPTDGVAVAVAMADKLDTLAGFFGIGELPTGSKDPFALRRAALGVIRMVLENGLRVRLGDLFTLAGANAETAEALLGFFADRLKVHLREQGVRHDLIASVFALGGQDDLVQLLARVNALSGFLQSDDGANLLAGTKRAVNILTKEEKKDGAKFDAAPDAALASESEEEALFKALATANGAVSAALATEDFDAAMTALAALRGPVDQFFDKVIVNADDSAVRANRLNLLGQLRGLVWQVADLSLVEG